MGFLMDHHVSLDSPMGLLSVPWVPNVVYHMFGKTNLGKHIADRKSVITFSVRDFFSKIYKFTWSSDYTSGGAVLYQKTKCPENDGYNFGQAYSLNRDAHETILSCISNDRSGSPSTRQRRQDPNHLLSIRSFSGSVE